MKNRKDVFILFSMIFFVFLYWTPELKLSQDDIDLETTAKNHSFLNELTQPDHFPQVRPEECIETLTFQNGKREGKIDENISTVQAYRRSSALSHLIQTNGCLARSSRQELGREKLWPVSSRLWTLSKMPLSLVTRLEIL